MNILSWNCRGTTSKGFGSLIRDMKNLHDSKFIVLMETHATGARASGIIKNIGLKGSFIQDAQGHSGGIWCLWDLVWWKVDVLAHSDQFVHMKVQWKNHNPWLLTVVYRAPQVSRRQQLWDEIKNLALSIHGEWVIIGDCNYTLALHERRGSGLDATS